MNKYMVIALLVGNASLQAVVDKSCNDAETKSVNKRKDDMKSEVSALELA